MEIQWGTVILITPLEFQGGTLLPPREAVHSQSGDDPYAIKR